MANLNVLQVVGYKNSGKTTLISSWIEELADKHLSAAVIKHHGHGGELDMPSETTDSMRFLEAGAVSSLAYGECLVQLHMHRQATDVCRLVQLAQLSEPDIIFIEGFKEADYPKVVLVKRAEDWQTLVALSNIVGVIVHDGVSLPGISTVPLHDQAQTTKLLDQWIASRKQHKPLA